MIISASGNKKRKMKEIKTRKTSRLQTRMALKERAGGLPDIGLYACHWRLNVRLTRNTVLDMSAIKLFIQ